MDSIDIVRSIVPFLIQDNYLVYASVCKTWRYVLKQYKKYLLQTSFTNVVHNPTIVQWAIENGCDFNNKLFEAAILKASDYHCLDTVEYLYALNPRACTLNSSITTQLVIANNIYILEWLWANHNLPYTTSLTRVGYDFDTAKWLYEKGYGIVVIQCTYYAVRHGDLAYFIWLKRYEYEYSSHTLKYAIIGGNEEIITDVIRSTNLEILQNYEQKSVLNILIEYNRLDLLCEIPATFIDKCTFQVAASKGDLQLVKSLYMRNQSALELWQPIIEAAFNSGSRELVQWLIEYGFTLTLRKITNTSLLANFENMIDYHPDLFAATLLTDCVDIMLILEQSIAFPSTILYKAITLGAIKIVQYLCSKGYIFEKRHFEVAVAGSKIYIMDAAIEMGYDISTWDSFDKFKYKSTIKWARQNWYRFKNLNSEAAATLGMDEFLIDKYAWRDDDKILGILIQRHNWRLLKYAYRTNPQAVSAACIKYSSIDKITGIKQYELKKDNMEVHITNALVSNNLPFIEWAVEQNYITPQSVLVRSIMCHKNNIPNKYINAVEPKYIRVFTIKYRNLDLLTTLKTMRIITTKEYSYAKNMIIYSNHSFCEYTGFCYKDTEYGHILCDCENENLDMFGNLFD